MNIGKVAMGTFAAAYVVGAGSTIALAAQQPNSEAALKTRETALKLGAVGAGVTVGVASLGIASSKMGISSLRFANSAPVMLGVALLGGAAMGAFAGSLFGAN